jgi:putative peptide zinc metalloprotease protein
MPILRKNLEVMPRIVSGEGFRYIIKDSFSNEVYEFGEEEFFICQKFDGKNSFHSIEKSFANHFGHHLKVGHIEAFSRQLENLGLLESSHGRFVESEDSVQTILLGNTSRLMNFLASVFSGCFSHLFGLAFFILLIIGIGVSIKYANVVLIEIKLLESGFMILGILAGFLCFNFLGEIAKGVTCRHYGGSVSAFYLKIRYRVIPYFFVDIGSINWINKKSCVIRIFLSSIIIQLLLFSVSMIIWENSLLSSGVNIFFMVLAIASFTYCILNINPFFERDGYCLLSVWLEIPDLKNRAVAFIKSWLFFRPVPEPLTHREKRIFKIYGIMWFCFQFVYWCLVLFISGYILVDLFKGLGACMFLCLFFLRFEDFFRRLFMRVPFLKKDIRHETGEMKWRLVFKLGLLLIFIIIMLIPYPYEVGGEFRLLPIRQEGIRAKISSEIQSVLVKEGDRVQQGQTVAIFSGRDQMKKFEEAKAMFDEAKARLDLIKKGAKPEEIAKAEQEVKAVEKSLEYSKLEADRAQKMFKDKAVSAQTYDSALRLLDGDRQRFEIAKKNLELVKSGFQQEQVKMAEAEVRRLEIQLLHAEEDLKLATLISPINGYVITPNLSEKVGQFLAEGELFAVIEDASTIVAEIQLPEEYLGELSIGAGVKLRAWAYPDTVFKGHVDHIAPVAYEKSIRKIERALSERELLFEKKEILRKEGKVVRVLSELPNADGFLKTETTGYAKIECKSKPVIAAFTTWFVRFILVEVWSWIP